jgi:hypothetical protein
MGCGHQAGGRILKTWQIYFHGVDVNKRVNKSNQPPLPRLDALEGPLAAEGAEPLNQSLGFDGVGVDAAALEVRDVGVVLQGAHVQASLLAQLRHAGPVRRGANKYARHSLPFIRSSRNTLEHI